MERRSGKAEASKGSPPGNPKVRPVYDENARRTLASLIHLKEGESEADLFAWLETLARGYRKASTRKTNLDPRNAATALDTLGKRIKPLLAAYELLGVEQLRSGAPRQLLADPPVSWDDMEDAIATLATLAPAIESATSRFRAAMGTSPVRPRPEIGWAEEVFGLWRRFDSRGALGKRDGPGRFERFLRTAAEPLQINVVMPTVHDAIRASRLGA